MRRPRPPQREVRGRREGRREEGGKAPRLRESLERRRPRTPELPGSLKPRRSGCEEGSGGALGRMHCEEVSSGGALVARKCCTRRTLARTSQSEQRGHSFSSCSLPPAWWLRSDKFAFAMPLRRARRDARSHPRVTSRAARRHPAWRYAPTAARTSFARTMPTPRDASSRARSSAGQSRAESDCRRASLRLRALSKQARKLLGAARRL